MHKCLTITNVAAGKGGALYFAVAWNKIILDSSVSLVVTKDELMIFFHFCSGWSHHLSRANDPGQWD